MTILAAALITVGVAALLINITERRSEGEQPYTQVVALDDTTVDPAVWGQNFPLQYESYLQTTDQEATQHGGSEAMPHEPTANDPRTVVTESKIEVDPRLVQMWRGYAFSVDYREKRGHAYMLQDQRTTRRVTEFKQPGTCLNCHASTYVLMKDLGGGDLYQGFDAMNRMTYQEATSKVEHPVACIDCHDPKTMQLRITRPAFMEGIKLIKAREGVSDYDVNRDATAAEKRTYVCAQCHVEYYFKGEGKTLTYPWHKGTTIRDAEAYYDEEGFSDWTHETTGAKMIKAQHPEFETYSQGVHARAGVSCADCHMPYKREGAAKISDHQVRSPMLDVDASCRTCHNEPAEEIQGRVAQIQERHIAARNVSMQALSELITDLEAAVQAGDTNPEYIEAARSYQRKATFYIDMIVSENSNGFHAPGESLRVLNDATNAARAGQLALVGKAVKADPAPVAAEPTLQGPLATTPGQSPTASPTASPSPTATPAPAAG